MATTGRPGRGRAADERDDPIVIGGVGGSATHTMAGVLQGCGLQLPGPVTPHLDSAFSIMLLKRPEWLPVLTGPRRARPHRELVQTFELLRALLVGGQLDRPKLERLAAAAADVAALGLEERFPGVTWWAQQKPFQFLAEYLTKRPQLESGPFGWKHPIIYLMLPELLEAFPRARYIHVLRDPLDMAWSSNMQGVRLWGSLAGIDPSEIDARPQNAQLAWWLHSTRLALSAGRGLGDRFMLVRLEQLVEHPRRVARQLAAFAGLEPPGLKRALEAVQRPESLGRGAKEPLDVFDPALLAEAQAKVSRWNARSGPGSGEEKAPGGEDATPATEDETPAAEDATPAAEDETGSSDAAEPSSNLEVVSDEAS